MAEAKAKKAAAPKAAKPAADKAAAPAQERKGLHRRTAVGLVVSNKMQKTIVVKVDRRVRHDEYAKYVTRSQRYQAHDENNTAQPGDLVSIVETRPMSRHKRWALQKIIRKSGQAPEINV